MRYEPPVSNKIATGHTAWSESGTRQSYRSRIRRSTGLLAVGLALLIIGSALSPSTGLSALGAAAVASGFVATSWGATSLIVWRRARATLVASPWYLCTCRAQRIPNGWVLEFGPTRSAVLVFAAKWRVTGETFKIGTVRVASIRGRWAVVSTALAPDLFLVRRRGRK
jgi:hypothetical protein